MANGPALGFTYSALKEKYEKGGVLYAILSPSLDSLFVAYNSAGFCRFAACNNDFEPDCSLNAEHQICATLDKIGKLFSILRTVYYEDFLLVAPFSPRY